MKVLSTSVPIFTRDIEAAIERYEALTGEAVRQRFELPEGGTRIAILGSVTVIAGSEREMGALKDVRATFVVDSLAEYHAHLRSTGATTLQGPSPTPAGTNLIVRDIEGVVFEFVEPRSKESSGTISFNQLHGECQTRIQQKRWCPYHNREVPNSEIVKGYEFAKGRYVVLSEEDFDKVRPESTRVIDLVQFADDSAIDPMYIDRAYCRAPDGKMAGDAFAVMREGMKGKVGIGKLALYGREYLVAVRPQERGILMYTLHHAAEIRSIDTVEELNSVATTVKPEEMKLAQQVI